VFRLNFILSVFGYSRSCYSAHTVTKYAEGFKLPSFFNELLLCLSCETTYYV